MNNISPQLQNQIAQFQQLQQQLQAVSSQKIQMESQLKEIKRAMEELDKASGDVYKNVGSLMIKIDDKEALKMELEESVETFEVRIKSIDRQEKNLREKYNEMQASIKIAMEKQQ
ncbi:MAG: prefoldin subunit beta [archaeon]|nr:prefoldin subunit beta [archaeon]